MRALGGFWRGGLIDEADHEPGDEPADESSEGHIERDIFVGHNGRDDASETMRERFSSGNPI
jgi:hypothetical protein